MYIIKRQDASSTEISIRTFNMPTPLLKNPAPLVFRYSYLFALSLLVGCSLDNAKKSDTPTHPPKQPPMPISVMDIHTQHYPASLELVAQTEGSKEIEVRSRVNGWLTKQLYQEGTVVKAGQALFQLDRAPFEIALTQAQAALHESQARLQQAKREYKRLQTLIAQHAISQKEADDAQTALHIAVAAEQHAQANVKEAQLNLSYTTITAPAGGLSGRALRTVGNLIGTNTSDSLLTSIVQIQPMRVRFSVSDNDLNRLGITQLRKESLKKAELILADGSLYPLPGKLDFLANQIDPTLGTRSLRALFNNPTGQLLPGQFVRLRLFTTQERQGVFVPQVAVTQTDKGFLVYTLDQHNTIVPRPVQVGEWSGSNWMITEGLHDGDRIAIDQIIKLKPGMAVMPTPTAESHLATPSK
jgi:membrane fusion protein, multidrug efflux system